MAYDLTHADGTIVLVGVPNEKVSIYTLPIHFNKVLTGSHGGDAAPHIDIPRIIRLNKAGKVSFDGIITHEFPLARDQQGAGFGAERNGRTRAVEYRRLKVANLNSLLRHADGLHLSMPSLLWH